MRISLQKIMTAKNIRITILILWLSILSFALMITFQPYPFFWKTVLLAPQSVQIGKQGAHIYVISPETNGEASSAKLFEDGKALGPEDALKLEIGTVGGGRYSYKKEKLFFSTSDNSDPRTNGRRYTLAQPRTFQRFWFLLVWACVLLGSLFLLVHLNCRYISKIKANRIYKVDIRPMLNSFVPYSWYGKLALCIFLAASLLITYFGRNERSGWNKIETPIEKHASIMSLIGWSQLQIDSMPLMAEDIPSIWQVVMFSGGRSDMSPRHMRAMMGFFGALFAPFLGIIKGLLMANYLYWAAAAWATWRFTKKVFKDELAAFIAVLLVAGGMGYVVHIADYGAHLMGFASYYLGILLIYESRVWCERRSLRIHIIVGLYLAMASLAFGTSLALLGGYVLTAAFPGRNRWQNIALAVVVALSARPLWGWYLNFLNSVINGATAWYDFQGFENGYWFVYPWSFWLQRLQQHTLIRTIANDLVQFLLFVDSPLVLIIGILSFVMLPRRPALWWFYFVFFTLPLACAIWVYGEPFVGLGYLIYGISLLVYSAFAGAMSKLVRQSGAYKPVAVILLVTIIIVHFGWSTAHFWNFLGPVKTYFYNINYSKSLLISAPAEVLSLTGAEPTPVLFGGNASLNQAGVYIDTSKVAVNPSIGLALLSRTLFFFYMATFVFLTVPKHKSDEAVINKSQFPRFQSIFILLGRRARSPIFLSFIALWILSGMFAMMVSTRPEISNQFNAVRILKGEKIHYTVALSDQFLDALYRQSRANPEAELWFFSFLTAGSCHIELFIGEQSYLTGPLPAERGGNRVNNPSEIIDALRYNRYVTLVVTALEETTLGGWQRNGLSGRVLKTTFPGKQQILPEFEIRLRSPKDIGTLIFAGF